jgi:hypothetical protein
MASNITYYYTRAMKNLFVDVELQEGSEDTFESISSMDDFWTVYISSQIA